MTTALARAEALLVRHWWRARPSVLAHCLLPLAWLYGALAGAHRRSRGPARHAPVPLLVVGNFIAGGAGKTPTVIALVEAFRAAGRRPGVISRGHGRSGHTARAVEPEDDAHDVGDEPLLVRRRTGVPVWVARERLQAAQGLCARHPEVDLLLGDDGLQHHALARDAAVVVFDDRGVGNGLLLPAGPLREPLPARLEANLQVLYTGTRASTALPGAQARRVLQRAWPLAAWQAGEAAAAVPLSSLRGRRLLAVAGLATPGSFFAMLEAAGLSLSCLPLPDHYPYDTLPWPAATAEVITTEKDAVKLAGRALGATAIWVVPLDLQLPAGFAQKLLALLDHQAPQPS